MAKDRKIDVVILGLLAHEDRTGYDIKKQIDQGIHFFFKGSFGSIYPALNDMEKQGLVQRVSGKKSKAARPSSNREKIFYHITESGLATLRKWLVDEQASNEIKYETMLKLFFGNVEGPEIAIRNIEVFEKQIRSSLEILQFYKSNLEKVLDDSDHLYYYLTVTFGIDTYEAYLKWCAKAKKMLKSRA